jgi:threonine synthase
MHDVVGWRCAVCRAAVDITHPTPWRCPNSTDADRHHVLQAVRVRSGVGPTDAHHPFVRYDSQLAWAASAAARGLTTAARAALVAELDDAIRRVDGTGFAVTPFERSDHLSDALGFSANGGVWVKDETAGVAGSQKARHLFTILLHLRASELLGELTERPRLAISSCGNAALAASTLAQAAGWPIDVYVPTWMSSAFGDRLAELNATIHRCERRASDPAGDPAMLRFREAVCVGAVPFTVQGPENALCLDGGRTIGWEVADQTTADDGPGRLDAVFVQVGGGAFAACLGGGLLDFGITAPLMAVQAAGCAPFARAFERTVGVVDPAQSWSSAMTPWHEPHSLADGILDDETYDWLGVLDVVRRSDGGVVVADETHVIAAHVLACAAGFDASPTGSSGLAGLLEAGGATSGALAADARVALVMSGVTR